MKINRLIPFLTFCSLTFSLSLASGGKFDVDFYDVGQGHCVIARTTQNGVLIIDAGSSSTVGVEGVTKSNKNSSLAQGIFNSIKNQLESGSSLNLIITHADKDHLNLTKFILEEAVKTYEKNNYVVKDKIKVIFGGNRDNYNSRTAKNLLKFIHPTIYEGSPSQPKIPCAFGSEFTEDKSNLLWIPPTGFTFNSDTDESVSFLSVKREVKPKSSTKKRKIDEITSETPSEEDDEDEDTNASSIVVKLNGGGGSCMITGDKTITEIGEIIGKYQNADKLKYLKSDVFLATHHGSENDFSPNWMKHVNPSYLIVSSGTSSFFHPRQNAVCSQDVLDNLDKSVPTQPWHPIRAYGNLSALFSTPRSIPIASGSKENFRSTPYSYSMTNHGIYLTADQGTIKFSFNAGKIYVAPTNQKGDVNFDAALKSFLDLRAKELTSLIIRPPSTLSKDLSESLNLCTTLESLDLSSYPTNDSHTDQLVEAITNLKELSVLKMAPNKLSEESKEKIRKAWGYKGLYL
jgi:beta-lactamase superfamily II metal-dependent hydrolase